jgi:hypothetical protein
MIQHSHGADLALKATKLRMIRCRKYERELS